jgi:hypothetical protein
MSTAVPFDTLEYMDEIKRSGMDQEHAEAITKATAKAFNQMVGIKELTTKKDLQEVKIDLIKVIHENTWKTIGILATFQTIIIGAFGLIQYLAR